MIQKKYIKPTTRVVLVDVEELMDIVPLSSGAVSSQDTPSDDDVIIGIDNSGFGSSNSDWDDEDEAL
nr:hypothetical protein [Prevotella sp.]